jgi:excisionase family DNA binding protein
MELLEEVRGAYEVREVAEHLGVAHGTVLNFIYGGELRAWRIGNKWKIAKVDLEAFLERCRPEAVNLEPSETQTSASL